LIAIVQVLTQYWQTTDPVLTDRTLAVIYDSQSFISDGLVLIDKTFAVS